MRYLKYNELNSSTYRNAANKLHGLGHPKRAANLAEYSKVSKKKETIEKWKKSIETYSKYGKIKVKISKLSSEEYQVSEEEVYFCFYPYLEPYCDDTHFLTRGPINDRSNRINDLGNWSVSTSISLEMWIIPQNEEQFQRINKILEPDYESFGFLTNTFIIKLDLEPNEFKFTDGKFYYEDGSYPRSVKVQVADRPSAGRIKILLKKFFNDSSIEYPIDGGIMYRTLLTKILANPGVSAECGISMEDFSEYISRISPNSFYTE